MSDVVFLLLTLACFAALAVLTGVLDRAVVSPDNPDQPGGER